ncbi:MAG TPA: GYD domain-containing protein [Chloroflexota bacterium]
MPLYVVLSKFTEQGRTDIKNTSDRLDRLSPVADKLGVKVIANAITMGPYDVVTVFEAPNDETIAQVIGTVLSRGYVTTQTMRGFSAEEFRKITSSIG